MADKYGTTEQEKADLSKERGRVAARIADPDERRAFIAKQGDIEAKKKGLPVLDKKNLTEAAQLADIRGYKKGTMKVPKTGMAVLSKGEMVVPSKKAAKVRKNPGALKALYGE